jgi:hypothetical protein
MSCHARDRRGENEGRVTEKRQVRELDGEIIMTV